EGLAVDVRGAHLEVIEHPHGVLHEGSHRDLPGGLVGPAVAPEVVGDDTVTRGEMRDVAAPAGDVAAPSLQEDHGGFPFGPVQLVVETTVVRASGEGHQARFLIDSSPGGRTSPGSIDGSRPTALRRAPPMPHPG